MRYIPWRPCPVSCRLWFYISFWKYLASARKVHTLSLAAHDCWYDIRVFKRAFRLQLYLHEVTMEYPSLYSSLCAIFSLHHGMGYLEDIRIHVWPGYRVRHLQDVFVSHAGQRGPVGFEWWEHGPDIKYCKQWWMSCSFDKPSFLRHSIRQLRPLLIDFPFSRFEHLIY